MILPHGTRRRICRALNMLRNKTLENPWKKHNNVRFSWRFQLAFPSWPEAPNSWCAGLGPSRSRALALLAARVASSDFRSGPIPPLRSRAPSAMFSEKTHDTGGLVAVDTCI